MDFVTVRDALATKAKNAGDFDVAGFIPDSITPPYFAVGKQQITYHQTFGGLVDVTFTCHLFASRADTEQGQETVLPYLDASGIPAALEADPTLGGACSALVVKSAEGPGLVDVAGVQFWAASFTVEVWG